MSHLYFGYLWSILTISHQPHFSLETQHPQPKCIRLHNLNESAFTKMWNERNPASLGAQLRHHLFPERTCTSTPFSSQSTARTSCPPPASSRQRRSNHPKHGMVRWVWFGEGLSMWPVVSSVRWSLPQILKPWCPPGPWTRRAETPQNIPRPKELFSGQSAGSWRWRRRSVDGGGRLHTADLTLFSTQCYPPESSWSQCDHITSVYRFQNKRKYFCRHVFGKCVDLIPHLLKV